MNETLYKLKRFADELLSTSSRKNKENILVKYKNDIDILRFLSFMYNPYIITGVSNKKIQKDFGIQNGDCNKNILDIMDWLIINNTGTDEAIKHLQTYIFSVDEELRPLVVKIFTKNLQLGIDVATINKCLGANFIPSFHVQLSESYYENMDKINGQYFYLTTKIDGGRIIAIKSNGEVAFFARSGQPYEGLVDLQEELENCPEDNFVLDGEITLINKQGMSSKEQYKETMKITRRDGEKHGVKMLVFDFLPLKDFQSEHSELFYESRRKALHDLFSMQAFFYFEELPVLYEGTDVGQIEIVLNNAIKNQEEGIMINLNAPYQFKRTSNLLKVKKMKDVDVPIIAFQEGNNKYKNSLGSFWVEYKKQIVRVGSGIPDDLRKEVWEHQDEYLGRTITVKYFEETTNSKGEISLRFPVFVDFRYDK